ncbi:MAG: alpha/beta hydrolase [Bryobacterales bacterium]|nr:alpha/beta hydrolase [Bryobacterales bacterium]
MPHRLLLLLLPALLPTLLLAQRQDPPFSLPESVELRRNLVYARYGQRELKADLYLPKSGPGPFPAVVYVHGGGWKNGSKTAFSRHAAHMATRGYAGLCIEYRLSGEATFPAALHDVKAAVRYLRAQAASLRLDSSRIGAAGGSAGGHLVALLGVSPQRPEWEGDGGNPTHSSAVQAVAAFNPAVDLVAFGTLRSNDANNSVAAFLGAPFTAKPDLWKDATPITHAGKHSPPFLFLHGDADTTVPIAQSQKMLDTLKAAGIRAEILVAPGAGHGFFNRPPWFEPTLRRMAEFFDATLAKP